MNKWSAFVMVLLMGLLMCGCEDDSSSDSTATTADTKDNTTTTATRGTLSASVSGVNAPYSIYVGGAFVGQNNVVISLAAGYYSVRIYNRNGKLIKNTTTTIIAGKTSLIRVSGAG